MRKLLFFFCCLLAAAAFAPPAEGAELPALRRFEEANRLYEQGKFREAIESYEHLVRTGQGSATVYFNLGNACYKAGLKGRAIAAYLEAQRLKPRDPNLRYNLDFVSKKASGFDRPQGPLWLRFLQTLTVDEWTMLAAGVYWVFFILLALREIFSSLRLTLRVYAGMAGVLAAMFSFFLWRADLVQNRTLYAVVSTPEAVLRWSPMETAEKVVPAPEGTELTVLGANQDKSWLQVQTTAQKVGWVPTQQVVTLRTANSVTTPKTSQTAN